MIHNESHMVQFGVWPNCCNACKFCLRQERIPYSKKDQLFWLDKIKENILHIDFKNKFSNGISLLGGELYYITDKKLQDSFLELIDIIIEKVLKVSSNPECKYSSVTNGLYDPAFLYKVVDKIVDSVGIKKVDLNFSYDLKYRFKNEASANLVLNNINAFHNRYDYKVGVQMILTQYLIDLWKKGEFDIQTFIDTKIPGNILTFLYPHPIKTGFKLKDFNFKRQDLFQFLKYLKIANYEIYYNFFHSTKNSCTFKYTGLQDRGDKAISIETQPILTDGKECLNPRCGHSLLYKCYADSDKCLLCDLMSFDSEVY